MLKLTERWRYKWAMWHIARGDPRPLQVLIRRWLRMFGEAFEDLAEVMGHFTPAMEAAAKAVTELAQALPRRDDGD